MVQVESGRIMIDGVDITNISPSFFRKRVSCVTQKPFIFTGTIRQNADPLLESPEDGIVAALEAVGIWDVITVKAKANGFEVNPLEARMDENFLSHGQCQLFAIARALLRRSRIVLFDEPTSRCVCGRCSTGLTPSKFRDTDIVCTG
jgi:ABC-type multidrug transport system fused ATPase/permease subunit